MSETISHTPTPRQRTAKPYARPVLVKGPVLSTVTAEVAVSGNINTDD